MFLQSDTSAQVTAGHEPSTLAGGRAIPEAELSHHAAQLGHSYRTQTSAGRAGAPLEGDVGVDALAGGLLLRRAQVHNTQDMRCFARLSPGIKIVLVLDGEVDVRFGGQPLPTDGRQCCFGVVVNLTQPTDFERRARAGTHEKSLTLTLPGDWLERRAARLSRAVPRLGCGLAHLAMAPWQPSDTLCALAQTLFDQRPAVIDAAWLLHCESLALAMAAAAWPALIDTPVPVKPETAIDNRRTRRMRDLADSGRMERMTLDEIARETGMSRASLQRHFRRCYDMSVQQYARHQRLQRARRALADTDCSVATAAEIAGYTNAANFTTAFKRMFGETPSRLRHHVAD